MSTKRTCHLALGLGLMLGLGATGCRKDNPAYLGRADAGDAGQDLAVPGGDPDGSENPDRGPRPDGKLDPKPDGKREPDAALDLSSGLSDGSDPFDAITFDSREVGGLDEGARDFGTDPVISPDRIRDVRRDTTDQTTEVPAGDAGVDAPALQDVLSDDAPSADEGSPGVCTELQTETCVTPGNPLVGACKPGLRTCSGGVWGPCSDIKPAETDGCNGIDDNCNGIVDEDCPASCVVVCNNCNTDGATPGVYSTIEAAIAAARQADAGTQSRICVAGGTSCDSQATYSMSGPLAMSDGVPVQGNYAMTADGPKYCKSTNPPNTTIEFVGQDQGVVFDQSIASRSGLSGFVIDRAPEALAASATASIAGVIVAGAKNVSLSRIFVTDAPTGTATYGVKITDGGQATIVASAIGSGQGRTAYGVYVSGGSVDLRSNCDSFTGGNCSVTCDDKPVLGIFGRPTDSPTAGETSAVYVGNASGAGSNVVANTICGGHSSSVVDGTHAAALRCDGPGCSDIAGNTISGGNDQESIGIAIVGAAPKVEGNRIEGGCGTRATTGVFLDGASAALDNNRIYGSSVSVGRCSGGASGPAAQKLIYGLRLRSTANAPSNPDVSSNDIEPLGPPPGVALACQGAGLFIERPSTSGGTLRNNVVSAGTCAQRFAIRLANDGGLEVIENNDLYGPSMPSVGPAVLYRQGSTSITSIDGLSAIPGAAGNISADPRYVSYPDDLHLAAASSPCVDTGTADGAPATDADGVARPQGGGYDVGAYELVK